MSKELSGLVRLSRGMQAFCFVRDRRLRCELVLCSVLGRRPRFGVAVFVNDEGALVGGKDLEGLEELDDGRQSV